jgi:hypothetical protein
MNMDIVELADYVTKWLVVNHPNHEIHQPYLDRAAKKSQIFMCDLSGRPDCIDKFLDDLDGILYVEHPIFRKGHFGGYDIIDEMDERGIPVFGIPMWEWWPEDETWAMKTKALWSVTRYTNNYLSALSVVLQSRGLKPKWASKVYGDRWGVNVSDFEFKLRSSVQNVIFVRGNAGYKDRKASDIILPVLQRVASRGVNVTINTQAAMPNGFTSTDNFSINHDTSPNRQDVYRDGDLFIFCSYWEGLCHGIYEASLCGGIVATTSAPPMDECVPAFKIPVLETKEEKLGKKISKSIINTTSLENLILLLHDTDCSTLSLHGHEWIKMHRSLNCTLLDMHNSFAKHI